MKLFMQSISSSYRKRDLVATSQYCTWSGRHRQFKLRLFLSDSIFSWLKSFMPAQPYFTHSVKFTNQHFLDLYFCEICAADAWAQGHPSPAESSAPCRAKRLYFWGSLLMIWLMLSINSLIWQLKCFVSSIHFGLECNVMLGEMLAKLERIPYFSSFFSPSWNVDKFQQEDP